MGVRWSSGCSAARTVAFVRVWWGGGGLSDLATSGGIFLRLPLVGHIIYFLFSPLPLSFSFSVSFSFLEIDIL